MELKVYTQAGKETETVALPKVFELPWNADLVHQVVMSQMANRRSRIAHVKGRGEVAGGGRKPWRQKGTGRARHGSIRSPLWKGGGVTHGPTKERNFSKKINTKMAARALGILLAAKIRDGEVLILDKLSIPSGKTKDAAAIFRNLTAIKAFSDLTRKERRTLVVIADPNQELMRALKNLPHALAAEARNITALDLSQRKYILLEKSTLDLMAKRITR